jgi:hypothetical protein
MEGADFSQRCPISVPLRSQRSPGLSHRVFSIWDFCLPFEAAPRIYSFLRQLFRCTAPHNVPRDNKPGSAVSLVSQNVDAVLFSGNSHAPPPLNCFAAVSTPIRLSTPATVLARLRVRSDRLLPGSALLLLPKLLARVFSMHDARYCLLRGAASLEVDTVT